MASTAQIHPDLKEYLDNVLNNLPSDFETAFPHLLDAVNKRIEDYPTDRRVPK